MKQQLEIEEMEKKKKLSTHTPMTVGNNEGRHILPASMMTGKQPCALFGLSQVLFKIVLGT